MIIPYEQASKKIWECLHSNEMNVDTRRGTIGFVLRNVAENKGEDVANALILKHNLNFNTNGSHNWFDDPETKGNYNSIIDPNDLFCDGDRRDATDEENRELYQLGHNI